LTGEKKARKVTRETQEEGHSPHPQTEKYEEGLLIRRQSWGTAV